MPDFLFLRMVKGSTWLVLMRCVLAALRWGTVGIVARYLSVGDFGLAAAGLTVIAYALPGAAFGVVQAVIRDKRVDRDLLDTAWTLLLVYGIIAYVLLAAAAAHIERFFQLENLAAVITLIATVIPLESLTNIGVIFFTRRLQYKKGAQFNALCQLVNFTATVFFALKLRNYLAIIYGLIAEKIFRCAYSYYIHPYRPRLRIERSKIVYLNNFGKWIFVSGALFVVLTTTDNIVTAKILGGVALGLYQIAFKIANVAPREVIHVIPEVVFPGFVAVIEQRSALRTLYMKTARLTLVLSVGFAGVLFIFAPEAVRLLLGSSWMSIVPAVKIFAALNVVMLSMLVAHQFFLAAGRPLLRAKIQAMQIIMLGVMIFPCAHAGGFPGVATAVLCAASAAWAYSCAVANKMLGIGSALWWRIIALPTVSAVGAGSVLYAIKIRMLSIGSGQFILLTCGFIGLYSVIIWKTDAWFKGGYRAVLQEAYMALKKGRRA